MREQGKVGKREAITNLRQNYKCQVDGLVLMLGDNLKQMNIRRKSARVSRLPCGGIGFLLNLTAISEGL
jgi:hypothetical protein